jgi:hypothetical protein
MSLYVVLLVIHVITAVGGLGQLAVFGIMTTRPSEASISIMKRILLTAGISLLVMLLTGVGMLWLYDWVYERTWWFRISFILFIALGAMHGMASKSLKRVIAEDGSLPASSHLAKLRTLAILMNITLALIVFLMEAKPF